MRVRVDPDDREHLTIDWRNPIRGLHESGPSVADILVLGTATRAAIRKCGDMLDVEPVDGKPVVFFLLDVVAEDGNTFEAWFAQPVPADVRVVARHGGSCCGAERHARRRGHGHRLVVVPTGLTGCGGAGRDRQPST